MQLYDQQERLKALDLTMSCVVRAPAGSGKTELLIQRYLKALLVVESPEQALILTFTNKAVAELKERIMTLLADTAKTRSVLTQELAVEVLLHSKNLSWNILENQHRLAIMTIDAYFLKLYERFMPQQLGVFPTLTEDPGALTEDIVEDFLAYYLLKEPDDELIALSLSFHNNFRYIKELFATMLGSRERWLTLLYQHTLEHLAFESLWRSELELLNELATPIMGPLELVFSFISQYQLMTPSFSQQLSIEHWVFLASLLLTQKAQWRKSFRTEQGIPAFTNLHPWHSKDDRSALLEALKDIQDQLQQSTAAIKVLELLKFWPKDLTLSDNAKRLSLLLKKLVAYSILYKQEKGILDFADITTGLWSLTRQEPEVLWINAYLDQHLTHLFIDEVQDLSLTQFAIVEQMITTMAYTEKTFFVVGDPQQAIYHFRGAEIGVFRRFEDYIHPGLLKMNLRLLSNFRSASLLVDFVNEWSLRRFGAYSLPLLGIDQALESSAVTLKEGMISTQIYSSKQQEAWQLALMIKDYQLKHPERTVGILGRDRKTLRPIKAMLDRLEIQHHAPDLYRLIDQEYILDGLALTKILLEPNSRYFWLDALRTCFFRASFEDIQLFFEDESDNFWEKDHLVAMSAECRYDYNRLKNLYHEFEPYRLRITVYRWVKTFFMALGFDQWLTQAQRSLFIVFLDFLQKWDWDQVFDWKQLEDTCARRTLHAGVESSLTLLTIHKAKGLEFDCVILPNLAARLPTADRPLLSYIHWECYALWAVSSEESDEIFDFCQKVNSYHQAHEAERLLYVALTRAKQELILSMNEESLSPRSFWGLLDMMNLKRQHVEDLTLPRAEDGFFLKIPQTYQPQSIPFELIAMNTDLLSLPEMNFYHELQRIIGLVLHDLFAWTKTLPIPIALLSKGSLQALWKKHGGIAEYFEQGLAQLGRLIAQCHQSCHAAKIFDNTHLQIFSEYELFYLKNKAVKKIIIDRVIQNQHGEWWIIEVKSMLQSSLSSTQQAEYVAQVQTYIKYLSLSLEKPVKGLLYFVADDSVVEIV